MLKLQKGSCTALNAEWISTFYGYQTQYWGANSGGEKCNTKMMARQSMGSSGFLSNHRQSDGKCALTKYKNINLSCHTNYESRNICNDY